MDLELHNVLVVVFVVAMVVVKHVSVEGKLLRVELVCDEL